MKVVVDTNVLLSSLLSAPTGTLNHLLDQIRTSYTLVLSLAMAVELGAVIVRPKFTHLGTEKDRVTMAQSLLSAPHIMAIVPTFTMVHPDLPDVDDNRLLEVAVAADADIIVTGDKQLLALNTISRPHTIEPDPPESLLATKTFILSPYDALDYLQSPP